MLAAMPKLTKTKRLRDSYRFPGFHPALTVRGLFGDPHARVISLTRRSKKRRAEFVAGYKVGGMIANCAGSGIFPPEACVSTLRSLSAGSAAGTAKG
jgi:hypothetical protein